MVVRKGSWSIQLITMKLWKYSFILLMLLFGVLVIALFQLPDRDLHLITCNVGQGDATVLVYKNIQILVDGGPDRKVLDCLGKYLPFWDRAIELVILTHPDKDHFGGLIDVFRRYRVGSYMYNPIAVSKPEYKVLENVVGRGYQTTIPPHAGQILRLGMIRLDIVNPSGQLPADSGEQKVELEVTDAESNAYSIVSVVSFGKFKALLTGDMPPDISDRLAAENAVGQVNYIKIPHHGSKNGLTLNLLKALEPKLAVISVGKNLYGHPAGEILKMLTDEGIKYLRTDQIGDIEVTTDGNSFRIK